MGVLGPPQPQIQQPPWNRRALRSRPKMADGELMAARVAAQRAAEWQPWLVERLIKLEAEHARHWAVDLTAVKGNHI